MATETRPTRPPGRPRNVDADGAILEAAVRVLARHGYEGMSMDLVAQEAEVGRATVYRRFASKAELVTAAIGACTLTLEPPRPGAMRPWLVDLLRAFQAGIEESDGVSVCCALRIRKTEEPELLEHYRAVTIEPMREQIVSLLRAAQARGELRADADLEMAIDMLYGCYVGAAITGRAVPEDWPEQAVALIWPALAPV